RTYREILTAGRYEHVLRRTEGVDALDHVRTVHLADVLRDLGEHAADDLAAILGSRHPIEPVLEAVGLVDDVGFPDNETRRLDDLAPLARAARPFVRGIARALEVVVPGLPAVRRRLVGDTEDATSS